MTRAGGMAFMVRYLGHRGVPQLAITRGGWASRASARAAFVKSLKPRLTWRQCYRRGCRVVMVDIREVRTR